MKCAIRMPAPTVVRLQRFCGRSGPDELLIRASLKEVRVERLQRTALGDCDIREIATSSSARFRTRSRRVCATLSFAAVRPRRAATTIRRRSRSSSAAVPSRPSNSSVSWLQQAHRNWHRNVQIRWPESAKSKSLLGRRMGVIDVNGTYLLTEAKGLEEEMYAYDGGARVEPIDYRRRNGHIWRQSGRR